MSEQYGWKIFLDDVNITEKVKSFSMESSLEMYCREISLDLSDALLFDTFDFSVIEGSPRIELFTRVIELDEYEYTDEYDPAWISQGAFFIERPIFRNNIGESVLGLWGRQSTAILGEPFAQKVTNLWNTDTTFYSICQEMLDLVGLTWYSELCDLQDFTIFADNFEADNQYPIDVLKELVILAVGAEGFVTSDRLGRLVIKRLDRFPTSFDFDFTDLSVQSINEEAYWPAFGNRIKVIPSETVSQNSISLYSDSENVSTGGEVKVISQVLDGAGHGVNNAIVVWSFSDPVIPRDIWFKYPGDFGEMTKTSLQNTSRILVTNEINTASGFSTVSTRFVPEEVVGIWAQTDTTRITNFVIGGSTLDGKNITIVGDVFDFYDQTLIISYYASGMVENAINCSVQTYESVDAEIVLGEITVVVTTSGKSAQKIIYVNNAAKSGVTISICIAFLKPSGESTL